MIKVEAKEFYLNNPSISLDDFDDPLSNIIELYDAGAVKVWVVDEYNDGLENPDTIYIDVGNSIRPDLLVTVCNLRPDECSYSDDGLFIRLWWD